MLPSTLWLIALLAAPASDSDPRAAARQILERGRYQTELPSGAPRPSTAPSDPLPSTGSGPPANDSPRSRSVAGPSIPLPPAALVWTVLAGLIVAGLIWAVRQAASTRRGAEADVAPPPAPEEERRAAPRQRLRIGPLTDVEELARQGRYGEAIHLLLLHLFAALQRRPTTAPAPAHTGREVLARTKLASDAKAALGVLVQAAESVHFGGRVAAREDYENCLGHYRRFVDVFERAM